MTKELRQSSEKLRGATDITYALAAQMTELLKLREAVRRADEAATRKGAKRRHRGIISNAHPAQADVAAIEVRAKDRLVIPCDDQASSRNGTRTKALPGRLFMRSQWR